MFKEFPVGINFGCVQQLHEDSPLPFELEDYIRGGENSRAPMIFSRLFQVGSPQCTEAACTICVRPTSSCQCDATQACVAEIPALSRRVRERRVVVVCSVQHFNIFHYQCLQCSHSFHYKYIVCAT